MQRDHLIGATVSAMSLGTLLLAFNGPGVATPPPSADPDGHTVIVMPKLPPEPPERRTRDLQEEDATVKPLAPLPTLPDIPDRPVENRFRQPVEPPPPAGLKPNGGVVTIPAGRWSGTGGPEAAIFPLEQLDRLPVARVRQQPLYPYEMRKNGITGEVDVEFIVTTAGDVVDACVIRSTNRAFEEPALQAVRHWRFRPGYRGGKPVNTRMSVPIVFNVRD